MNYPGLESDQHHKICDRYLKGGFGCIITFGLKDGYEAAKSFVDNTEIFRIVANLGDTKSLIIHPAARRTVSSPRSSSARLVSPPTWCASPSASKVSKTSRQTWLKH